MTTRNRRLAGLITTLLMAALLLLLYRRMPEEITTQWRMDGSTGTNSRSTLWGMVGMNALCNILFDFLPRMDPRRKNYRKFLPQYNLFLLVLNVYMFAFFAAILVQAFYPALFSMGKFSLFMLGILLMAVGNLMPKFRSNFFSGIKTPWALSSEENWRKTHRLGGKLFFASGLFCTVGVFFLPLAAAGRIAFMLLMAAAVIPYAMSYYWWRRSRS